MAYIDFGEALPDLDPSRLTSEAARKTFEACRKSRAFSIVELRRRPASAQPAADVIVVECTNDQVPTRNKVGIRTRERLALVFYEKPGQAPEVRALRRDFPVVAHLNHVRPNEPAWLCLYFEPWSAVARWWTPERYLQRILGWLSESAKGTLHRPDQPLEQIYFNAGITLVLPPELDAGLADQAQALVPMALRPTDGEGGYVLCGFAPKADVGKLPQFRLLLVQVAPVLNGPIERHPSTLGELHDQLAARGAPLVESLRASVRDQAAGGLASEPTSRCVLLVQIPRKRSPDGEVESTSHAAFNLGLDLATVGKALGVLHEQNGRFYAPPLLGGAVPPEVLAWRDSPVEPVAVSFALTAKRAREASDIDPKTADFNGVLAGVGALGSALAETWAREAWGRWTYVDPQFVEAHNVARHEAKHFHIGRGKADAVKHLTDIDFHPGYRTSGSVRQRINDFEVETVAKLLAESDLLIDATTALDVPRDLARRDSAPRSASVFLTPSGLGSALLLEDADRRVRLDSLEGQYYRAVLGRNWGAQHLLGHRGHLWVGAGCRDASAVLPYDAVRLHAAILAAQLRRLRDQTGPCVRVWHADPETGSVRGDEITVRGAIRSAQGRWNVLWDEGVRQKLRVMRNAALPSETGGVVIGYVDHVARTIHVVDVLPPPPDSLGDESGFVRGAAGLPSILEEVRRRTANIVDYVGEWHSHPPFASARPSSLDKTLAEGLARQLSQEGQPVLMMIVGAADEVSISVKEA